MAVGGNLAAAKSVVQQNVLPCQFMVVRRDLFSKEGKVGIAVAARLALVVQEGAKDLVVSSVLLDDVEDILDRGRVADPRGNRVGTGAGRARRLFDQCVFVWSVGIDLA